MKALLLLSMIAAFLFTSEYLGAKKASVNTGYDKSDDEEFLTETAQVGILYIDLAGLAQTNGSLQSIKDFASTASGDYTKWNGELKALMTARNITFPSALSKKGQRTYEKFVKKTGHEFDKEYIDLMAEEIQTDIDEFEETSGETKDTDIKAWIAKTLPILKQRAETAKSLYKSVK